MHHSIVFDFQEQCPSFEANVLIGEALMRIQEPDKAVKAFEDALELKPKDSALATRIAEALVASHEYQVRFRCCVNNVNTARNKKHIFNPNSNGVLLNRCGNCMHCTHVIGFYEMSSVVCCIFQRAIDFYHKAIRNNPEQLSLQIKLGEFLVWLKEDDQGISFLKKSIAATKTQGGGGVEQQSYTVDM